MKIGHQRFWYDYGRWACLALLVIGGGFIAAGDNVSVPVGGVLIVGACALLGWRVWVGRGR
jgi:hypothetical protein